MERAEAEAIVEGDRETAVALLMRVGELVEANRRLEARVAELERRLDRSSRNSSLPPSQDPPIPARLAMLAAVIHGAQRRAELARHVNSRLIAGHGSSGAPGVRRAAGGPGCAAAALVLVLLPRIEGLLPLRP